MSFRTPPAIQHRAWNLFLRRDSGVQPPFDFPFFVAGNAGGDAAICYAFDPSTGFQYATISTGLQPGTFRMLAVGPYAAYAVSETGIYETTDGVNFTLVNATPAFDPATITAPACYTNGVYVAQIEGSFWRSVDGINWAYANNDGTSVCVHNGAFFTSADSTFSTNFTRSTDGLTWTPLAPSSVQAPAFGTIAGAGYIASDGVTLYVGVQNDGTTAGQQKAVIYGSDDDGDTWTIRRTLLSVTTATLTPAAGLDGFGVVYARTLNTGRHMNTGSGFTLQNSPFTGVLNGAIAARRNSFFECNEIGEFAVSTGAGYSSYVVPLDSTVNVA